MKDRKFWLKRAAPNYNGGYTYGSGKNGIYRKRTVEVGQFPANAWGLHDMHGNVWEWTASEYREDYGGAEVIGSDGSSVNSRMLRGGSWSFKPLFLRSACRYGYNPRFRSSNWGFRLARTLSL